MKILIRQFLSKNHSWSHTGYGIARGILSHKNQIDLFSTDGNSYLPQDLKQYLIGYSEEGKSQIFGKTPGQEYDCQISYTAPINFQRYLNNCKKNKFGIWCYEWNGKNVLPNGFAKCHQYCDLILAPSNFAKEVFINSGVPENKIKVISHGINVEQYQKISTIELPTKKKFKILANIAQNHKRKNIPGLLETYGKAFTNKDDVCLIIKGKEKSIKYHFDVSLNNCLKQFNQQFPNHAEVKVYSEYLDDISALYRSVDLLFTMSYSEAFYIPGLEALASNVLNIAPNYGGQLDFLNNTNSLLIEGKTERADPSSMYWEQKQNAIWFRPDINDAVEKLRYAYNNQDKLKTQFNINTTEIHKQFSWNNIAQQIINICQ